MMVLHFLLKLNATRLLVIEPWDSIAQELIDMQALHFLLKP